MVTLMELQRLDQQNFQPNICLDQNKCLRVSALEKQGMVGRHYYFSRLMTKPKKWHVRPAKTQISLGIRLTDNFLYVLRNAKTDFLRCIGYLSFTKNRIKHDLLQTQVLVLQDTVKTFMKGQVKNCFGLLKILVRYLIN